MSIKAYAWAKAIKVGSPTLKAVLCAVADYADDQGRAWPSLDRVAEETEFSARAVRKAVAELADMGLLTRKERFRADGGRSTDVLTLQTHLSAPLELGATPHEPPATPPEPDATPPAPPAKPPSKTCIPRTTTELPLNASEATASGRAAGAALPSDASWNDRLWFDGKAWLMECGCSPKAAGDMIGRWLRDYRDPEAIHAAICKARDAGTQNAIPLVIANLKALSGKPQPQHRRRSTATTRLIERMEARRARQADRDEDRSGPVIEHEGHGRPHGLLH